MIRVVENLGRPVSTEDTSHELPSLDRMARPGGMHGIDGPDDATRGGTREATCWGARGGKSAGVATIV